MTDALDLYPPILTLKPVAEGLWVVDGPIVEMAMYGARIPFPTRATVVRLASGALWVHSPTTALPDSLRAELAAIGPVAHLVSPNLIHYAGIPLWAAAYPQAQCWASPGVQQRAASQGIVVRFDAVLEDAPDPAWADTLEQHIFRGSRYLEEVVFLHRSSRTLLLADLIENFERDHVHSALWRGLISLAGSMDPDGKAPLDLRATFWGQKDLARASLAVLRGWAPERIILSHGRWYDRDGVAELERAFRWLQ